jgi:hypothetical protein
VIEPSVLRAAKGKLFFLAIFLTFTSSIFAQSPSSFYKAKKLLYKLGK